VGPVRISLKAANQKSKKYTLCVYVQESCVEVKDRVLYEVVQLAVSHDAAPIELIATQVGKDGIVGCVEVPRKARAIDFYLRSAEWPFRSTFIRHLTLLWERRRHRDSHAFDSLMPVRSS
jgi:hypothetical protein